MSSATTPGPPDYEQSLALYESLVAEYRFQVQLNWDRAKYLMGFNTAVFGVGIGLLKLGGRFGQLLVAGVFAIGLVGCVLAGVAVRTQHRYYVTVRNQMSRAAAALDLGALAVNTTPGSQRRQRGLLQKLARVQSMIFAVLVATAVADVFGLAYVVAKH